MKTTTELANDIFEKYYKLPGINTYGALSHSIKSVEITIKVLTEQRRSIEDNGFYEVCPDLKIELDYTINKQSEILNELKSRIK